MQCDLTEILHRCKWESLCHLVMCRQTVEVPHEFKLPRYGVRGNSSSVVAWCLLTISQGQSEDLGKRPHPKVTLLATASLRPT
jgi:hypothetical protein